MSTLRVRGLKHDTSALEVDNLSIESNGSGVSLRAASDLRLTLGSEGTVGANTSNWVRAAGQKLMLNAVNDFDVETNGTLRLRIQGSNGNLQFNSGYGSVATAFGCRAFVNFNGSGTASIRGSGNVSSVTRNTNGDYTVNFTIAMPDANYAIGGSANDDRTDIREPMYMGPTFVGDVTTTSVRVQTGQGSFIRGDSSLVSVTIHR